MPAATTQPLTPHSVTLSTRRPIPSHSDHVLKPPPPHHPPCGWRAEVHANWRAFMHAAFPKKADGLSHLTHTWHTKNSSSGVLDFLALSFFSRSLQKFGVQKCTPLACKSTRQIKNPYLQQIHDGHLACASARQIFEPTMCFCRPLQQFWMQRCTPAGVQKCTPAGVQKCTPRASLRA